MTYPLTPADDIVGPIVSALSNVLTTQISGLGRMYTKAPDGPPENNSVIFPLTKVKFEEDTNGKFYVRLTFRITYIQRRSKYPDNIQALYTMFSSMSRILSSWPNQTLGGASISVCPKDAGFTQWAEAGTSFVALFINTEVLTEYNILTS